MATEEANLRIWLDDLRPAPRGWIWTKTVAETIAYLQTGNVDEVSLDYDLDHTDPGHTGLEVARIIREMAAAGQKCPVVHVHTANPVGASQFAIVRNNSEQETGVYARNLRLHRHRVDRAAGSARSVTRSRR